MLPTKKIFQKIIEGDEVCTVELCRECLLNGYDPMEILEKSMIPAMDKCGVLLTNRKSFIPQVLMSTRAMQAGIDVLKPYLSQQEKKMVTSETVVIGTVKGDIHTIGKTLVSIMLESVGFTVIDLGTNISEKEFIDAVEKYEARFVMMSAMLTTAMMSMRKIVKEINHQAFAWDVTIIVGGAPITQAFAKEIGAVYADNAIDCMDKILKI
ncbi:cobalamin-dependent protein [Acetobacterium wieringae]|uniref:cobalamin-dependent protein n=1 Tax=Acetobacterium wieringae TaxID=52694 RepID=UPI003158C8F2